jgi:hypothetical protein
MATRAHHPTLGRVAPHRVEKRFDIDVVVQDTMPSNAVLNDATVETDGS